MDQHSPAPETSAQAAGKQRAGAQAAGAQRPGPEPTTLRRRAEHLLLRYGTRAEAWVALLGARLLVSHSLHRISRWAFAADAENPPLAPPPQLTGRIVASLGSAARALPGETVCLPRAIAAKWMLSRRGWPSTIRLGVGTGKGLHAHAWLESNGETVLGADGMDGITALPSAEQR